MSISERQYTKILSEELLKYLLEGKVPDTAEIATKVSAALSRNGSTTYQYFQQPNKDVFQIDQYNNSLKQIKFDIDTFQEELLDLFAESIKRINYADLYHKIHSYELNNLQAKLEAILFSIENADYYFLNAYDNFTDTSKLNTELSTTEVLNVSENVLNLPYGSRATKRISTSHLINFPTWTIDILNPDRSIIYSTRDIVGSKFGSMFTDTLESWSYELLTKQNGAASIQFVFPLAGASEEEVEVLINRFEVVPLSIGNQTIKIEISTDNINFSLPLGYEEGIKLLDSNKVYALDFETDLVQYVRVTLTKNSADQTINLSQTSGEDSTLYQYVFGLKSIAAYTTGRVSRATYISKPFSFDGNTNISKISIKSDYTRPEGTNLSYSIALTDTLGELVTDYIPINPIGTQLKASALTTVTFENNLSKSQKFSVGLNSNAATLQYGTPYRSRYLYKLFDELEFSPIFNSIELVRGYNAWAKDNSVAYSSITVPDCYLNFSYSETESLYYLKTENCTFQKIEENTYGSYLIGPPPHVLPPQNQIYVNFPRTRKLQVNLSIQPYFDASRGHLIRPPYTLNGAPTSSPNYAIYKVRHIQARKQTTTSFFFSSELFTASVGTSPGFFFNLPITNFVINSSSPSVLPKIRAKIKSSYIPPPTGPASTPVINPVFINLVEGTDYTIETTTVDGVTVPTGRIKILPNAGNGKLLVPVPAGSVNLPPVYNWNAGLWHPEVEYEITYTPEIDITHKIISIENKTIILDNCYIEDSDLIEVTYRYVVTSPDQIIRSSIEVYDLPTTNEARKAYREGIDYLVNANTNVIRRLESGTIPTTGGVHITYKFNSAESGMEVFTTWCKVDNPAGSQIRFDIDSLVKKNKLQIDTTKGEALYVNGPFGLIDITNAAGTPVMPPGWVQFIVKSKNPFANSSYKSNLIDQVIQLRDINRQKIFREGNIYFSTILAYRELMIQRTLNHLKVNTLATDNQSFAVDDDTNPDKPTIVVNFLPNRTSDLYNYGPTPNEDGENPPVKIPETYTLTWLYPNEESIVKSNNLVVRIDLDRNPNVDGALTPKVHNYQVRVGL
jgi:hypothetical protein